jgi:hypothetical protein
MHGSEPRFWSRRHLLAAAISGRLFAQPHGAVHYVAGEVARAVIAIPDGERQPLGWPVFGVAPGDAEGAVLRWKPAARAGGPMRFRVTVGLDMRGPFEFAVSLAGSGKELGILDVRYGHVLQPYELSLAASDATAALREGVRLRMVKGAVPAFFLHPDAHAELPNVALRPHLLDARSAVPAAEFRRRLLSFDSVQMFGWMQDCPLDGLLAAERAWKRNE